MHILTGDFAFEHVHDARLVCGPTRIGHAVHEHDVDVVGVHFAQIPVDVAFGFIGSFVCYKIGVLLPTSDTHPKMGENLLAGMRAYFGSGSQYSPSFVTEQVPYGYAGVRESDGHRAGEGTDQGRSA